MSSILARTFTLPEARSVRYVGTHCYNDRNQIVACPMNRTTIIITAIFLGLFVLACIAFLVITRCSCRRRNSIAELPVYRPFPTRYATYSQVTSTETLVEPAKTHPAVHPYQGYHV